MTPGGIGSRRNAEPGERRPGSARRERIGPPLALVLAAITLISLIGAVPLGSAAHQGIGPNLWLIPYAGVGGLIATVSAFAQRLRDAVELDAVEADLLATVKHAVPPAHVSIWIGGGQ